MTAAAATSPPKRITRARAAAKKEVNTEVNPSKEPAPPKKRSTKRFAAPPPDPIDEDTEPEMEPPRRPTRRIPASTTLNAPPRRKIKVTPLNPTKETKASHISEQTPEQNSVPEPETGSNIKTIKKSLMSGNGKKAAIEDLNFQDQSQPKAPSRPKTRGKGTTSTGTSDVEAAPRKTRSRAKKTTDIHAPGDINPGNIVEKPRRTRTRSGAAATRATTASAAKVTAAPKKKVTFQEPSGSDKENLPLPMQKAKTKNESIQASTQTCAKTVRKSASLPTKGRPQAKGAKSEEKIEPVSQPLSPKKITQIAKSSSSSSLDSEEDELSGGKTPLRVLAKSPMRSIMQGSPVKGLDFHPASLPRSPEKRNNSTVTLSPPRRPPPSPFKDAMKGSPRRAELPFVLPQPSQSTSKATPKSLHFHSSLQQSPKRGNIDSSIFQNSTIKQSRSPIKASLLQSPARRLFSPTKASASSFSPENNVDFLMRTPKLSAPLQLPASPSRSEKSVKVSASKPYQDQAAAMDFDESILNVRSPIKVSPKKRAVSQPSVIVEEGCLPVIHNDLTMAKEVIEEVGNIGMQQEQENAMSEGEGTFTSLKPSKLLSIPIHETGDTPRVSMNQHLFRSASVLSDDESEDELQSVTTPVKQFIRAGRSPKTSKAFSSQAESSPMKSGQVSQGLGFTPLAVQLGNWLSASPDRPMPKKGRRGVFSPAKLLQPSTGEATVATVADSTPSIEFRRKVARRDTMANRKSLGGRKSCTSREFAGLAEAKTPQQPTFFEDEMIIRDLEEDLESLGTEDLAVPVEVGDNGVQNDDEPEEMAELEHKIIQAGEAVEPFSDLMHAGEADQQGRLELKQIATGSNFDVELGDIANTAATSVAIMAASDEELESTNAQRTREVQDEAALTALEHRNEDMSYVSKPESMAYLQEEAVTNVAQENAEQEAVLQEDIVPPEEDEFIAHITRRAPLTDVPVQTPSRPAALLPHFLNTVISKVPLRQEGQDSPLKVPRKRSRSLSADPKSPRKTVSFSPIEKSAKAVLSPTHAVRSPLASPDPSNYNQDNGANSTPDVDTAPSMAIPMAISDETLSSARKRSPTKSTGVLSGAVVFTDVYTSEGADASGIFIDLLTQMGARCVKQWNWNPRASIATSVGDNAESDTPGTGAGSKIGITHVIYKDGGKRTLEKVRDAKGVVKCVGVGWVLDCEGQNAWVDENPYAVDISILPRGGSRRRKSMEPRALVNQNGNMFALPPQQRKSLGSLGLALGRRSISVGDLTPARKEHASLEEIASPPHAASSPVISTPTVARTAAVAASIDFSPDASADSLGIFDGLTVTNDVDINTGFDSPVSSGFSTPTGVQDAAAFAGQHTLPATPTGHVAYDPSFDDNDDSPDTPYLVGQGAKLMGQGLMSCPPKQTRQGLFDRTPQSSTRQPARKRDDGCAAPPQGGGFPPSGRVEEVMDPRVRRRLEMARRRTLGIVGGNAPQGNNGARGGVVERLTWKPSVESPLGQGVED